VANIAPVAKQALVLRLILRRMVVVPSSHALLAAIRAIGLGFVTAC
jgi:hypothetical protein